MRARPKVDALPLVVREELVRRLMGSGSQGFRPLAAWLSSQGYNVSPDAIRWFAQRLQRGGDCLDEVKRLQVKDGMAADIARLKAREE